MVYINVFVYCIYDIFILVVIVFYIERMDLRRVKDEDKLDLCRKYFYGSYIILLNVLWCLALLEQLNRPVVVARMAEFCRISTTN